MKFPFLDKAARSMSKSASDQVKKEIKKTSVDLIPGLLTFGGMLLGMFIFGKSGGKAGIHAISTAAKPFSSTTRITTNNYFLGNVSEEIIKKVLEEQR